jgi:hypothetical protein
MAAATDKMAATTKAATPSVAAATKATTPSTMASATTASSTMCERGAGREHQNAGQDQTDK